SLSGKFDVISPETSAVGPLISISLARFERGMAAGKDTAAHDLMLHMYIRREKLKHAPTDYAQHQGVAEMSRATPR
ncbi:hypothetical protein, partial [Burkholderia vietnamiensis]|uniref:hypothetical protein n=1 Tax=Burkholderia vietnamiensis TaxID=60552 RepID=UPI001E5BC94F